MQFKLIKIFLVIFIILYHNVAANAFSVSFSKPTDKNNFNQKYLSNYFSALLSYNNQQNDLALKYFESSKPLVAKNDNFLKKYIFSLIYSGQVSKAIKQAKYWQKKNNSSFFEAKLLIILDSLNKKKFKKSYQLLKELEGYKHEDSFELVILETLKSYNWVFLNKTVNKQEKKFGNFTLINNAFQNCYIDSDLGNSSFLNLINSSSLDYSRYLFFYLNNLIENKDYILAKEIASTIELLDSSLLISQAKQWIDNSEFGNFKKHFSCKNENDILSELFFLISNIYSSEDDYEKSNFYLNISYFLNSKFYFNLSLLAENYYLKKNYKKTKDILIKFDDKKHETYIWYKVKKDAQIISIEQNEEKSLNFIENKFFQYKEPSNKIIYDMANIYKRSKKYKESIIYYSKLLSKLNENSKEHAEILYRRGGSYERIKDHEKSDKDLLMSLEIRPDDPYVMNYLAYSWLERNYKINEAIEMLQNAYKQKKDDPYIIDSVGWGYFLIEDYINAEKYINRAAQLMPDDPIVNDHYGDILWKLNRKIQAKYFWKNALESKESNEEMKKKIKIKLLKGLNKN